MVTSALATFALSPSATVITLATCVAAAPSLYTMFAAGTPPSTGASFTAVKLSVRLWVALAPDATGNVPSLTTNWMTLQ